MQPLYSRTPLIKSDVLKLALNKNVYLKLECLQPSGSFKLRGMSRICQHEAQQGAQGFISSSGGNAGIAVAYCGMKLGIPVTVFIPESSNAIYIDWIKLYGAQVKIAGSVWDEAHQAAQEFSQKNQVPYIPPFDHPLLWQGHATMIPEVVAQGMNKPEAVVLAVGGGGLACGVLDGMHQAGWQDVPLIAVETEGADAFAHSVAAGQLITLDKITSKATSLGAKRVAAQLLDWTQQHEIKNIVVSDTIALNACARLAREQRILTELSSGAALSVVYDQHPFLQGLSSILVIICGGVHTYNFL